MTSSTRLPTSPSVGRQPDPASMRSRARSPWPSSAVTTSVGTGFCGALTTYSTFAYETLGLAECRAVGAAVANLAGVVAALLGWLSARALI